MYIFCPKTKRIISFSLRACVLSPSTTPPPVCSSPRGHFTKENWHRFSRLPGDSSISPFRGSKTHLHTLCRASFVSLGHISFHCCAHVTPCVYCVCVTGAAPVCRLCSDYCPPPLGGHISVFLRAWVSWEGVGLKGWRGRGWMEGERGVQMGRTDDGKRPPLRRHMGGGLASFPLPQIDSSPQTDLPLHVAAPPLSPASFSCSCFGGKGRWGGRIFNFLTVVSHEKNKRGTPPPHSLESSSNPPSHLRGATDCH